MMSDRIEHVKGSGNVYKDLGFRNPDEWSMKADIASKVYDIIEERGLTQREAGEILGIAQGRVSDMKRGQFDKFSLEKLLSFLVALDRDVDIFVRPKARDIAHVRVAEVST